MWLTTDLSTSSSRSKLSNGFLVPPSALRPSSLLISKFTIDACNKMSAIVFVAKLLSDSIVRLFVARYRSWLFGGFGFVAALCDKDYVLVKLF